MKTICITFFSFIFLFTGSVLSQNSDFRNSRWGSLPKEVKNIEIANIDYEDTENIFYSWTINNLNVEIW